MTNSELEAMHDALVGSGIALRAFSRTNEALIAERDSLKEAVRQLREKVASLDEELQALKKGEKNA